MTNLTIQRSLSNIQHNTKDSVIFLAILGLCLILWLRTTYLLKKVGHSRPLFIYFRLFNTVDNKQMLNKFCRWLESNRGPLVSKAASLPTEPQPLPNTTYLLCRYNFSYAQKNADALFVKMSHSLKCLISLKFRNYNLLFKNVQLNSHLK